MDDIISNFVAEALDSLNDMDADLVLLEQNTDNDDLIGNIFRLLHTVKGTCGFLGLTRLEAVAHVGEDLLDAIRNGKLSVTSEVVTLILESLGAIRSMAEYIQANGSEPEGDDSELIKRLSDFLAKSCEINISSAEDIDDILNDSKASDDDNIVAFDEESAENDGEGDGGDSENAISDSEKDSPETPVELSVVKPQAQHIRVRLDVLQSLMQMVGELVLTRNQLLQLTRDTEDDPFAAPLQRLSRITSELQDGVMKTRMQPISSAWVVFPRMVRDISLSLDKKVQLNMDGGDTELDRVIIDTIKDPLTHMVRNAVDHGLENAEERRESGKPESGVVDLSAYHEGGQIIIDIKDDGKGLDVDKIRKKAIEKGLRSEDEILSMNDHEIRQFIFAAGFSTAEEITNISGRGVGMDVVCTNIEKIGGTIEVDSEVGKGSVFRVRIPLTLAIISALIVKSGGVRFAIPQTSVLELVQISPKANNSIENINNSYVMRLRGKLLPLIALSEVLECAGDEEKNLSDSKEGSYYIMRCSIGSSEFGIIVDEVCNIEEIVVKPASSLLNDVHVYSGSTILGDGSIIMVIDINGISKYLGKIDDINVSDESAESARALSQRSVSFMLFETYSDTPKAVPLELVSRLERIDESQLEHSVGLPVVRYRDRFMHIFNIDGDGEYLKQKEFSIIVFDYDGRLFGVVAKKILDISEAPLEIRERLHDDRFLGSMVINDRVADVIDVASIKQQVEERIGLSKDDDLAEGQKAMILLVEDDATHRNLLGPYLSARGYGVVMAESGEKALGILEKDKYFDLIISDIEMPDMNGFDFGKICKSNDDIKHIPVIAFTGRLTEEVIVKGNEIGFHDYISKTDREGLVHSIESITENKLEKVA